MESETALRTGMTAPAEMVLLTEDQDSMVVAAEVGILAATVRMTHPRGHTQVRGSHLILFTRSFAGLYLRIACTLLSRRR